MTSGVEAALRAHASVRDCAVIRSESGAATAFVALAEAPFAQERAAVKEKLWEMIFDKACEAPPPGDDPTLHIGSWTNSFTRERFDGAEMRRAVTATVARIERLGARRILEIGCSTGLLLFRLARGCERYVGYDLAAGPLAYVREQLASMPELASRVELHQRSALDLAALPDRSFDALVMDSVVQYFPSSDYLAEVIRRAARVLSPGGHVFLGDVRSLPLLPAFLARAGRALARENELVLDPAFVLPLMRAVPEIADARVLLKRGADRNELTMFRYDVVLTMNAPRAGDDAPALAWRDWSVERMTLERLRADLARDTGAPIALRSIPNARLDAASGDGVDPDDLFRLGDEMGYDAHVGWSDSSSRGDAAVVYARGPFRFLGVAAPPPRAGLFPLSRFAHEPRDKRVDRALAEIEALARDALGGDARVVRLAEIPRGRGGDVDLAVLRELA